eukprot:gene1930-2978_t
MCSAGCKTESYKRKVHQILDKLDMVRRHPPPAADLDAVFKAELEVIHAIDFQFTVVTPFTILRQKLLGVKHEGLKAFNIHEQRGLGVDHELLRSVHQIFDNLRNMKLQAQRAQPRPKASASPALNLKASPKVNVNNRAVAGVPGESLPKDRAIPGSIPASMSPSVVQAPALPGVGAAAMASSRGVEPPPQPTLERPQQPVRAPDPMRPLAAAVGRSPAPKQSFDTRPKASSTSQLSPEVFAFAPPTVPYHPPSPVLESSPPLAEVASLPLPASLHDASGEAEVGGISPTGSVGDMIDNLVMSLDDSLPTAKRRRSASHVAAPQSATLGHRMQQNSGSAPDLRENSATSKTTSDADQTNDGVEEPDIDVDVDALLGL